MLYFIVALVLSATKRNPTLHPPPAVCIHRPRNPEKIDKKLNEGSDTSSKEHASKDPSARWHQDNGHVLNGDQRTFRDHNGVAAA